jgi:Family of unknown function (DUF5895)
MKPIKTSEMIAITAPIMGNPLMELPDFTTEEYIDQKARVPRITALRGESDPKVFGLFVKLQDAVDIELSIPSGIDLMEYTYSNGDTAEGYMFQKDFGLCVMPLSPLLAFSRRKDGSTEQAPLPEAYDASRHKGDPDFTAGRIYDVLLVANGELLHIRPLRMVLKGAASATFTKAWEQDVIAVGKLYSAAMNKAYRPMTYQFNRLVVFRPTLARELAGTAQKSTALVFSATYNGALADRIITQKADYEIVSSSLIPFLQQQVEQPLLMAINEDMPF